MKLQLQRMHKAFGREHVHKCGECCNLLRNQYSRVYYKCARYGDTGSESTDWALKWEACKKFNIPLEDGERPLMDYVDRRKPKADVPGQIKMGGIRA